jgi:hypothetical protein
MLLGFIPRRSHKEHKEREDHKEERRGKKRDFCPKAKRGLQRNITYENP